MNAQIVSISKKGRKEPDMGLGKYKADRTPSGKERRRKEKMPTKTITKLTRRMKR